MVLPIKPQYNNIISSNFLALTIVKISCILRIICYIAFQTVFLMLFSTKCEGCKKPFVVHGMFCRMFIANVNNKR